VLEEGNYLLKDSDIHNIDQMLHRVRQLYLKVADSKAPKKKLIMKGVTDIDDNVTKFNQLKENALQNLDMKLKSPIATKE